jgi:Holliday junction DNA helicase RuvA
MISFLKGKFIQKTPAQVWIEVGGVGYEVNISLNTYSKIEPLSEGMLYTHLLIREDAHLLFGFFDLSERDIFQQLIGVSGIGASTARVMLSYMKPEELAGAILRGDTRSLEAIKGIGKKTAERMVLELKDKLAKHSLETNNSTLINNTLHQDSLNALMALGISRQAASLALEKVLKNHPDLGAEELIKLTLRSL